MELNDRSLNHLDDIPEAIRDDVELPLPEAKPQGRSKLWLWSVGAIAVIILVATVGYFFNQSYPLAQLGQSPEDQTATNGTQDEGLAANDDSLLGHLPYEEAPAEDLVPITADGQLKLRTAAAKKFLEMQEAARREGVILSSISAFRSIDQQQKLFFAVKETRGQEATERALVSAPPGYSEHHTGYTIDIGDGKAPSANLSVRFAQTEAFKWLQNNASRFSFELSFPENNAQGINYEPWHWRYVGDRESLETFYKSRRLSAQDNQDNQQDSPDNVNNPTVETNSDVEQDGEQ
jgi:D-alanyl-D-alanine carboxypeptidase